VIGGFYIGERHCILHALGKKKNLTVFNLVDFHNSPNRQHKFYVKFSSYMVSTREKCYRFVNTIAIDKFEGVLME